MAIASPRPSTANEAASVKTTTLFVVNQEFPKDFEDERNRWFDRDHVPERVACPGFKSAQRFQRTTVVPAGSERIEPWFKYLNFYELENPEVMISKPYLDIVAAAANNAWSARQRERVGGREGSTVPVPAGREAMNRTFWQGRPSPWTRASHAKIPPPRTVFVVYREVDQAHAAEVNAYLDEEHVPDLLSCSGFLRAERFYKITEPGSTGVKTQPGYMDIYDLEAPEVLTSDEYKVVLAAQSARGKQAAAHITERGCGVYLQRPSPWLVTI